MFCMRQLWKCLLGKVSCITLVFFFFLFLLGGWGDWDGAVSPNQQNYCRIHLFRFVLSLCETLPAAATVAKSLQSCPTLCDPIGGSPPGLSVPGILQARTLEWAAISFSDAWKWKVKVKSLSGVWLFATPWTAAHQAPPSMGFSRQEYWSGVPLPSAEPLPCALNYKEMFQRQLLDSLFTGNLSFSWSIWFLYMERVTLNKWL